MGFTQFKNYFVAWGLLFSTSFAIAYIERVPRCAGGDGPHPLVDISSGVSSFITLLPTGGHFKEFALAPEGQEIILQRENHEVVHLDLRNLSSKLQKITTSEIAIDNFTSPLANLFSTKNAPWVFDRGLSRWWRLPSRWGKLSHLFWDNQTLYSYSTSASADTSTPKVHLHQFDANSGLSRSLCTVSDLKMANGHQYPFVHFYRTQLTTKGSILLIVQLDVTSCRVTKEILFQTPMAGPVEEVHRFEAMNATLVKVNHPHSNLLWQTSARGCRYFDLEGAVPLIFNHHRPLMASFSENQGFRLIDLNGEKTLKLFSGAAFTGELSSKHLALSPDGTNLYLAPSVRRATENRSLIQLDLSNFNAKKP